MAENFLSKYLTASFDKKESPTEKKGLVVTISRQKGCGAFPITQMILHKLNSLKYPYGKKVPWKMMSKEILEASADKLKMKPGQLDPLIERQGKNVFDEIILSLTQNAIPSDIKIRNTIRNVIENAASEGNIIIIGRGGVFITKNYKNSLHIRLEAPLEWRVNLIAKQEGMSLQKAEKFVKERDLQREALKRFYHQKVKTDIHIFDIVINVSTMKQSEIAEAIFSIIKQRQDALMSRK